MDFVYLSMEDPPRALAHGVDLQKFRTRVRRAGSGGDPTFRLRLYEGGTPRATLLDEVVSSEVVLESTWDAATLAGRGGEVEIRLEADRGSSGATVEIAALTWVAQILVDETSPISDDLTLQWVLYANVAKDVSLKWSTLSNFVPNFSRTFLLKLSDRTLRASTRELTSTTAQRENTISVGARGEHRLIT